MSLLINLKILRMQKVMFWHMVLCKECGWDIPALLQQHGIKPGWQCGKSKLNKKKQEILKKLQISLPSCDVLPWRQEWLSTQVFPWKSVGLLAWVMASGQGSPGSW